MLSMHGANGYGYGIPLSYVAEAQHLYFHGAPEGFKLDSLRGDNRVSFCVVGATQVIPRQFTTAYESVLVFGRITVVTDDTERVHALRQLSAKYSPEYPQLAKNILGFRCIVRRFYGWISSISAERRNVSPTPWPIPAINSA